MQKHVHLVDIVKSFPTNIFLQNLASIQKSTSPLTFAHLAEKIRVSKVRYRTFQRSRSPVAHLARLVVLFLLEHQLLHEFGLALQVDAFVERFDANPSSAIFQLSLRSGWLCFRIHAGQVEYKEQH